MLKGSSPRFKQGICLELGRNDRERVLLLSFGVVGRLTATALIAEAISQALGRRPWEPCRVIPEITRLRHRAADPPFHDH
jgi:hypothetical protein